jgi:hypothetical protein
MHCPLQQDQPVSQQLPLQGVSQLEPPPAPPPVPLGHWLFAFAKSLSLHWPQAPVQATDPLVSWK